MKYGGTMSIYMYVGGMSPSRIYSGVGSAGTLMLAKPSRPNIALGFKLSGLTQVKNGKYIHSIHTPSCCITYKYTHAHILCAS